MGSFPVANKWHRGFRIWLKKAQVDAIVKAPKRLDLQDAAKIPEFPQKLFWHIPGDLDGMVALINACCDGNIKGIAELLRDRHPNFVYGVEGYLQALIQNATRAAANTLDLGAGLVPPPPLVPLDKRPLTVFPIRAWQVYPMVFGTMEYLNYESGEEVNRIRYLAGPKKTILTEILGSLDGSRSLVTAHYPGRWRAWGVIPRPLVVLLRMSERLPAP